MFDGKDDLKAEYRRVEVLTGPGRRRRWSAEDKARSEARAGLLALPADGTVASLPVPDFVPIVAEPAVSAAAPAPAPEAARVPVIEVEIAGAVVRVRPGMDEAQLASVLRTVRASAVEA